MRRDDEVALMRTTPHSAEAEASILGALMLDSEAMNRVHGLMPEAFYDHANRLIFEAAQSLAVAGKPTDIVSLFDRLGTIGKADEVGGLMYLNSLAQYVPSAANIRRYVEIVNDRYLLRKLVAASDEVANAAFNPEGQSAEKIIDAAQMALAKLATVRRKRDPEHINESLSKYLALLQDLSEGKNPALSTGISGLDKLLNGGGRRGEMMVIGARPKHGKTALALALARNFARKYSVLFISQEMPVSQLMHRHTAAMGTFDIGRILRADAHDHDMWEAVTLAARKLGDLSLVHDDQSAQSLMDIRRKAIQVKRQYGLDVLFVDFLQLMQGAGEDNRNRELDVIVNGLKGLALDLDIFVVALSQMSRKADESYHRPTMTHLRDSGAIEAAADQIALLFTDHAHPLSPKLPSFAGFSELEIVAHRNGPPGLVPLSFAGVYQQVGDWDMPVPQRVTKTTRGMDL